MKLIDIIVLDKSIILQISTLKEREREKQKGKSLFLFPLVIIIKNKRNKNSIDLYDNSFLTFNFSKRSWGNFIRLMYR
jgi:hypothetical protein